MPPPPSPPPQLPFPGPDYYIHQKLTTTTSLPDLILSAFSLVLLSFSSSSKPTINLVHKFPLYPRRFLKFPTMSLQSPNPHHLFPTPQSLSDWLKPRLPSHSFASWGVKPGTKNVHNLWLELSDGEISLDDSTPPLRTVQVVIVRILGKTNNKFLLESKQELSDGSIRHRGRPLSEKMKTGETVELAVVRAVREELGSVFKGQFSNFDDDCCRGIVVIVPNSYTKKVEERVSVSYPGLPAFYVLHTVDVVVEGLPEEENEFCTEETEEYGNCEGNKKVAADGAVSCKKHYWKWVDSDSV